MSHAGISKGEEKFITFFILIFGGCEWIDAFIHNDAKKRATDILCQKFRETITFLGDKIEKNFFYKKWAIFVAA